MKTREKINTKERQKKYIRLCLIYRKYQEKKKDRKENNFSEFGFIMKNIKGSQI